MKRVDSPGGIAKPVEKALRSPFAPAADVRKAATEPATRQIAPEVLAAVRQASIWAGEASRRTPEDAGPAAVTDVAPAVATMAKAPTATPAPAPSARWPLRPQQKRVDERLGCMRLRLQALADAAAGCSSTPGAASPVLDALAALECANESLPPRVLDEWEILNAELNLGPHLDTIECIVVNEIEPAIRRLPAVEAQKHFPIVAEAKREIAFLRLITTCAEV